LAIIVERDHRHYRYKVLLRNSCGGSFCVRRRGDGEEAENDDNGAGVNRD